MKGQLENAFIPAGKIMFWKGSLCNLTFERNNFVWDSIHPQQVCFCLFAFSFCCERAVFARRSFRLWYLAVLLFGVSKHLRLQSAETLKQHTHQQGTTHSRGERQRMHLESRPERPCSLAQPGCSWLAVIGCVIEHHGSTHSRFVRANREAWKSHLTLGLDVTFNSRALLLSAQTRSRSSVSRRSNYFSVLRWRQGLAECHHCKWQHWKVRKKPGRWITACAVSSEVFSAVFLLPSSTPCYSPGGVQTNLRAETGETRMRPVDAMVKNNWFLNRVRVEREQQS